MKVKIGDKVYDGEEEPVMIILSDKDKQNISSMGTQTKYCSYPEGMDVNVIEKFMQT